MKDGADSEASEEYMNRRYSIGGLGRYASRPEITPGTKTSLRRREKLIIEPRAADTNIAAVKAAPNTVRNVSYLYNYIDEVSITMHYK